jgi:hypothetical protein
MRPIGLLLAFVVLLAGAYVMVQPAAAVSRSGAGPIITT